MLSVFLAIFTVLHLPMSSQNRPVFDNDAWIQVLFLPYDTPPGTVIFRTRATDNEPEPQYPLTFTVESPRNNPIVYFESVSETEGDLILARSLQKNQITTITIQVKDTNNEKNMLQVTINATDAHATPSLAFTNYPRQTIFVREDALVGHEVTKLTAKKNQEKNRFPELSLTGSSKFSLTTQFSSDNEMLVRILLKEQLDYEDQRFYLINITSLGGYTEKVLDNRNIVIVNIPVVVLDVTDTGPRFNQLPLITEVNADATEGSAVLKASTKESEGDDVRYTIDGDNNEYFKMDPRSGEVTVARPLHEIIRGCQSTPLHLRVSASKASSPQLVTTQEILLLVRKMSVSSSPVFSSSSFTAAIDEHSPAFTLLTFQQEHQVRDENECAVLELILQNSIETKVSAIHVFDIKPNLVLHNGNFDIFVRNSTLLDYETFTQIQFQVVAFDKQSPNSRATADVVVSVNDINDNAPQFTKDEYVIEIAENIGDGTIIAQVTATDKDGGNFGKIRYTGIAGDQELVRHLKLDEESGTIVFLGQYVFDREVKAEHEINVEARDIDGRGAANVTKVILRLKDVNDNRPLFPRSYYQVCLPTNQRRGVPFFNVWAEDLDEPGTQNSEVSYSIIRGNDNSLFYVADNGYLSLNGDASRVTDGTVLIIRATDKGATPQSSEATVHISKEASGCRQRVVEYLVENSKSYVDQNKELMESFLMNLNGGSFTRIDSVRALNDGQMNDRIVANNVTYPRARIRAYVTEHDNSSVMDLTFLKRFNKGYVSEPYEAAEGESSLPTAHAPTSDAWKWVLIALLILLALVLLGLLCCCLCRPNKSNSKHHAHHHHHHHRGKRISSAPVERSRGVGNGRVPTNIQYSRHMQEDWNRNNKEGEEILVDPTTGKRYLVRNENGHKILVRQDDEKSNRKVTRGTNVTESTLQTEGLVTDANGTVLDDDGRKSRLKSQFLEKKSLFTIAYDGMHSKHDLLKDTDDTSPPTVS